MAAQRLTPAAADRNAAANSARTPIRATPDINSGPDRCLADVVARFVPYFEEIVPDLKASKTVLIAAHGNSLRALVKYLDGMSDEGCGRTEQPTGIPAALRPGTRPQSPVPAAPTWTDAAAAGARGRRGQPGLKWNNG